MISRLLIEFELLKVDPSNSARSDTAMLVMCSMGALTASLLSYVNQHLWCWKSLLGMTLHLAKVSLLLVSSSFFAVLHY